MSETKQELNYTVTLINTPNDSSTTGDAFNLTPSNILECFFYEDLFSMNIIGKLSFLDKMGTYKTLGDNFTVLITYGTESVKKAYFKLRHFTVQDYSINEDIKKIDIHFTDASYARMHDFVWPAAFPKMKISDIVQAMFKKYIGTKKFRIEPTNESMEGFIMPHWSGGNTVKYLACRGSGSGTGVSGYLLYQTSQEVGELSLPINFVTLQSLLKQTKYMGLNGSTNIEDATYFWHSKDYATGHYNKVLGNFKRMATNALFNKDIYGPVHEGYALDGKKVLMSYQDFTDKYNKMHKMGEGQTLPEKKMISKIIRTGEDDAKVIQNMDFDRFIKTYCLQNCYVMKVVGHESRYAGGLIEVAVPGNDNNAASYDSQLKGKYLVKSIMHIFKPSASYPYIQKMTLIKNAFNSKEEGSAVSGSTRVSDNY